MKFVRAGFSKWSTCSLDASSSLERERERVKGGEMASSVCSFAAKKILRSRSILRRPLLSSFTTAAAAAAAAEEQQQQQQEPIGEDAIFIQGPRSSSGSSVSMPTSSMTGSIIGKRFYKEVTTRRAEGGVGWSVMLDYRTLKTPSKRPLKIPTRALAHAIAAEWDYQQTDGIRPFTMPLMKLACTALERVPLTRTKIIESLMAKFHQDLVFCRSPGDCDLTKGVLKKQEEKFDPILEWVESELGLSQWCIIAFSVAGKRKVLLKQ
ncbi:ATP synthase mitochondrial F1 complex assembly factor 2 [Iris pallida]|uniref:ATP synthase mitochondrial F1 complex assembly factor 2 n=1 Tax=Iris pallida TaxID=29817 RepID=A0AAX6GA68_IRIPA|nr:ATP synthase mitochondrial F1 complex assembly factor 2 [Iris pallida]